MPFQNPEDCLINEVLGLHCTGVLSGVPLKSGGKVHFCALGIAKDSDFGRQFEHRPKSLEMCRQTGEYPAVNMPRAFAPSIPSAELHE
jgi:hypothetical protein